ncbi:hypothetical protein MJO29_005075, partial [Puccinia striiformis f. sp. tritici]
MRLKRDETSIEDSNNDIMRDIGWQAGLMVPDDDLGRSWLPQKQASEVKTWAGQCSQKFEARTNVTKATRAIVLEQNCCNTSCFIYTQKVELQIVGPAAYFLRSMQSRTAHIESARPVRSTARLPAGSKIQIILDRFEMIARFTQGD